MTGKHLWAVVTIALLGASSASAGGLFIPGTGPQASARAGAFAAKADDPSAMHHNPAGVAKTKGTVIHIGAVFVDMSLEYTRAGSYETPTVGEPGAVPYPTVKDQSTPAVGFAGFQAIPLIAVTTDLGGAVPGVRFGVGLLAPQGFPERNFGEYDFEDPTRNAPPNRYDVQEQDVSAAFPSFAATYSLGRDVLGSIGELDFGARFSWGFAGLKSTTYVWALRNYEEDIANDGQFTVDAKDNFIPSFGVGVLYRPIPQLEFGLNYNSGATIGAKGEASSVLGSGLPALGGVQEELLPSDIALCEEGGEIGALKACIDIKLAQTATLGGRYVFRDEFDREIADIELDVRWEGWSSASDYGVVVDGQSSTLGLRLNESFLGHGLKDVLSVRLGGAYSFKAGPGKIIVRAGAAYDTEAAPAHWQRLDFDTAPRTTLGAGLAWEGRSYRIDAGGGAVIQPERVAPDCNPDLANPTCANFPANTVSPSPAQPLQGPNNQTISPFNSGRYKTGYTLLSLGVTTWF